MKADHGGDREKKKKCPRREKSRIDNKIDMQPCPVDPT